MERFITQHRLWHNIISFHTICGAFNVQDTIKAHYCHNKPAVRDDRSQDLSHIEFNAIRYTAGYVPRALKKKLIKSGHKNKKDLFLCLNDLIACDGEDPGPSTEWIYAIDHGGLTHLTFELFLTMHGVLHTKSHTSRV